MANMHMQRCSVLVVIREMLIKTAMRCELIPSRMAPIKQNLKNKTKQKLTSVSKDEQLGGAWVA